LISDCVPIPCSQAFFYLPSQLSTFPNRPKTPKQRSKPLGCLLRMQISSERIAKEVVNCGSSHPQNSQNTEQKTASNSKACQHFVKRHMLPSSWGFKASEPEDKRQKAGTADSNENNIVLHSLYLYLWRSTKGFLENA